MSLKINNRFNLNKPFRVAIEKSINDYIYSKGEYTVGELLKTPDSAILLRRCIVENEFDLEVDYIDFFNTLQGNFADSYVKDAIEEDKFLLPTYSGKGRPKKEDYNLSDIETGRRRIKIPTEFGVYLSGAYDYILEGTCVQDLKNISRVTFLNYLDKYYSQLNIYAYMLKILGHNITCLNLDIIIKDPKPFDKEIPVPIFTLPVKMWDFNETEKFIYKKLKTLIEHEKLSTLELIDIAKKNRYSESITKWAVKKNTNKINTKVFKVINGDENQAFNEATAFCENIGGTELGYNVIPIIETRENIDYSLLYSIL